MPRPPAPRAPTGRDDHQGRHRRGRSVEPDAWDEWDDPAMGGQEPPEVVAVAVRAEGEQEEAAEQERAEGAGAGTGRVRVFTVPESLRSVDVQVGARAVRGLLLVAAVVLLVLGGRWWWVAQGAGAEPVAPATVATQLETPPPEGAQEDPGASSSPGVKGGGPETGAGEAGGRAGGDQDGRGEQDRAGADAGSITVVVHVVGEVRSPGVVELAAGSRVADAVAAAGGLTDGADQSSLNLARALVDGEQVWVGAPGEEPPPAVARGAGAGPAGVGAGADRSEAAPPPPLDLNLASQADLEELPGIGPVTAGHILAWRDEHGRFSVIEELMEVSGIGERTFAQLEPLVTVGG